MVRAAADDVRFLLYIYHKMMEKLNHQSLWYLALRGALYCRCFCISDNEYADWPPLPSVPGFLHTLPCVVHIMRIIPNWTLYMLCWLNYNYKLLNMYSFESFSSQLFPCGVSLLLASFMLWCHHWYWVQNLKRPFSNVGNVGLPCSIQLSKYCWNLLNIKYVKIYKCFIIFLIIICTYSLGGLDYVSFQIFREGKKKKEDFFAYGASKTFCFMVSVDHLYRSNVFFQITL